MKKLTSIFVTFLLLITLIFISCKSEIDQPRLTGEVSFAFTVEDLDRITGRVAEANYRVEIYLSVDGDVQSKTTSVTNNSVAPVTFTDIPIGSMVAAFAVIFHNDLPVARGESNQITIKDGENRLTIRFVRVDSENGGNDQEEEEEEQEQEELPVVIYSDSSTPIILWNGITAENELKVSDTNTYTHVISQAISGSSFTRGAKVFNTVNENTTINSAELPSNVYCFGDDCIYAVNITYINVNTTDMFGDPLQYVKVEHAKIEKYTSSGSGYVKDTAFTEIDIADLYNASDDISSSGGWPLMQVQSIGYGEIGGQGYFFVGYYQKDFSHGENLTGCFAIDPSDTSNIYGTNPNSITDSTYIPAIQVVSDGSEIDLYYAQNKKDLNSDTNRLMIKKVHVTGFGYISNGYYMLDNSDRAGASSLVTIDLYNDATLGLPANTLISDIKLIGDYFYVSVYAQGAVTSDSDVYFETSTSTEQKALTVSNGGIIKVDLSGTPAITAWSNGDKVLGWYRKTYYVYDQSGILTEETNGTIQPPLSQKSQYFYGAKKILAKITESGQPVLFVADDGAYIDAVWDNGFVTSVSSRNMNRIVKVNLTTESISAYNVNVSFDASVISETYDSYGYSIFGVVDL